MSELEKSKTNPVTGKLKLFGNVRVMAITALFVALSIVLGKFLPINIGNSLRISFENLPIVMAGIFFGPVIGLVTGLVEDVIGCILYGYSINPIITLGACSIGFISGYISNIMPKKNLFLNIITADLAAHIVGSMIIKSIGMWVFFGTAMSVLMLRIPIYMVTGIVESVIIFILLSNNGFTSQLRAMGVDTD